MLHVNRAQNNNIDDNSMAEHDMKDEDFYRVVKATTGLSMKEIREIEDVFEYFDTDHDGTLSQEQATLAWRTFGIQAKESDFIGLRGVRSQRFVQTVGKYNKSVHADNGGLMAEYFERMYHMVCKRDVITPQEILVFLRSSGMKQATLEECKKLVEAINRFGFADEFSVDEFVRHMVKSDKKGYLAEPSKEEKQNKYSRKKQAPTPPVQDDFSGHDSESSVEAHEVLGAALTF